MKTAVEWHPASDPQDDDTDVLVYDGEEVFQGFREGAEWYSCTDSPVSAILWAHIPWPRAADEV